jgi:hypothetical protein
MAVLLHLVYQSKKVKTKGQIESIKILCLHDVERGEAEAQEVVDLEDLYGSEGVDRGRQQYLPDDSHVGDQREQPWNTQLHLHTVETTAHEAGYCVGFIPPSRTKNMGAALYTYFYTTVRQA